MSDPQPAHLKPKPRRADPVQPDKPGSGNATQPSADAAAAEPAKPTAQKNAEQSKAAIDNVSEGYD